jgi:hypothetical protein
MEGLNKKNKIPIVQGLIEGKTVKPIRFIFHSKQISHAPQ